MLGISAGWLWTSSGYCITAYSTEADRGKYLAIQGTLSSIGSLVGAGVTLGIVAELPVATAGTSVPQACYIVFTTLMITSPFVAGFLLKNPNDIIRSDGTKIAVFRNTKTTTLKREFLQVCSMVKDWKVSSQLAPRAWAVLTVCLLFQLMIMLPVFFASVSSLVPAVAFHCVVDLPLACRTSPPSRPA